MVIFKFLGSQISALSLLRLVQKRHIPIPFFAEMSSSNPMFFLQGPLKTIREIETLIKRLIGYIHLECNQFSTQSSNYYGDS